MKHLNNRTSRSLSYDEHRAILECAEILEKAFKSKIFTATINPDVEQGDMVYGVQFAFDKWSMHK